MERAALGLSPELRTPPTRSRTTHVEVGTGQRARAWNYALNITSVDPPIGSSLTACDLASHDDLQKHAPPRARLLLFNEAEVSHVFSDLALSAASSQLRRV